MSCGEPLHPRITDDGIHRVVVTHAGPVWSTPDSYRLRLDGPEGET